jgi:hypothetical protein
MLQISNRCLGRVSKGSIGGERLLECEMQSFDVHREERGRRPNFGVGGPFPLHVRNDLHSNTGVVFPGTVVLGVHCTPKLRVHILHTTTT